MTLCMCILKLLPLHNDSETGGNVAATLVGGIAGSLDDAWTVCAYTHEDACSCVSWLCRYNCGEVEKAEPQGQGGVAHQL